MVAASVLQYLLLLAPSAAAWKAGASSGYKSYSYINYTTVTGFFLQDDPSTVDSSFDYVSCVPASPMGCHGQWD